MIKCIIIILFIQVCCFTILSGQTRRVAISARVAETSMMLVIFPISLGVSGGANLEYRIVKSGFIGVSHSLGYSLGLDGFSRFKIRDSELYYYLNNYRFKIINQAGLRVTNYEEMNRRHYLTYGDRVRTWGFFVGNNRISFFKYIPRLIFGIQYSLIINHKFERDIKYTLPTSFLFLSFRYMINSDKRVLK